MGPAIRPGDLILGALPRMGLDAALSAYLGAGLCSFLLPGELLAEPRRLAAFAAEIRAAAASAGVEAPLLALGRAEDPREGLPAFLPSPLGLAALPPAAARAAALKSGWWLGRLLASAGIELYLGPRLDLASDPKSSGGVLGFFGDDPELAGRLGAAFQRGLSRAGVSACAYSFPGCGALSREGRSGLPLLALPAERLELVEMRPFARAIRAGLPALLVARALVPGLEPARLPAARSVRLIEGRLRTALRFKGLVIGASLDEDAEGPGRAAVLGALAGADLSIASSPAAALAAVEALGSALESGELPLPRALVARRRLAALKGSRFRPRAESIEALLGSEALARFVSRAREGALTLFRGGGDKAFGLERLLVVLFFGPKTETAELEAARRGLAEELPGAELLLLSAEPGPEEVYAFAGRLGREEGFDAALVFTLDAHFAPTQESLVHLLEEGLPAVGVIALGDPYDAAFFPRAKLLGAVYGFSAEGVRLGARLALGRAEARGRCPVPVLGLEV